MKTRIIVSIVLAMPAAFAFACGGSDAINVDGGGDSAAGDGTTGNDTGTNKDSGSADTGTGTDSGSDTGTTDAGSNDSGGFGDSAITCTAPSDCTNQFCCGTIVFNGGQLPNCNLQSVSAACKSTCKSNVQLSCNATDTIRGCAQTSDCADAGSGYTKCCTVPFGDAAATFCWSSTYAGYAGGSCM